MIKPLWKGIRQLFLFLLVLSALLILAAQLMMPRVSSYRGEAEAVLSRSLGIGVSLGAIEGRWRGFGPEFELRDIRLHDANGGTLLRLAAARANIHLLDSLLAGQLMPREITLSQLRILIQRRLNHSLIVAGLEGAEGDATAAGISLVGMPFRVNVDDASIRFEDAIGAFGNQQLDGIDLTIVGDRQRFQITSHFSPQYGKLQLHADLSGDLTHEGAWSGAIYLKGADMALARLIGGILPGELLVEQGVGEAEIWSRWQAGRVSEIRGQLAARSATIGRNEQAFSFDRMAGSFHWLRKDNNWDLNLNQLRFRRNGIAWRDLSDGSLSYRQGDNGYKLAARLNRAEIADLSQLVRLFPVSPSQLEQLAQLSLGGVLNAPTATLISDDGEQQWGFSSGIKGFTNQPHGRLPGLHNLSGQLTYANHSGQLTLDTANGEIFLPTLFLAPIPLQRLAGEVTWRVDGDGHVIISSQQLDAVNQDVTTQSRFLLKLPSLPDQSPWLDLQTDFRDGDASQVSRYLPVGIMPPATIAWLDRAIVSGKVPGGSCILRGPLREFPFHTTNGGRFEVLFQVEDGVLDYQNEWPPIEQLNAEIHFVNNRFAATASSGRLYTSQIDAAQVTIDSLHPTSPLHITGETSGPVADGLKLLRESPLRRTFKRALQGINGKGDSRITIDASIPLAKGEYQLSGKVDFHRVKLELDDWQLRLNRLTGPLRFDLNGIYADELRAELKDQPLAIRIGPSTTHSRYTRIDAQGRQPIHRLAERFPMLTVPWLSGESEWQLGIDLPPLSAGGEAAAFLEAKSTLLGTAVDLPAPMTKEAASERPFQLLAELRAGRAATLELHYGEIADGLFALRHESTGETRIEAGEIALGKADLTGEPLPPQALRLRARMAQLDLTPWLDLLGGTGDASLPPLDRAQVIIGHLAWNGNALRDLSIKLESDADQWHASLHSDRLTGRLDYPRDPKTATAELHLSRINIVRQPTDSAPSADEEPVARGPSLDPRSLPAFHFVADQLLINGNLLGSLEIDGERRPDGIAISRIAGGRPADLLEGHGEWLHTLEQGDRTSVNLALETASLGQLLADLELAENLRKAPAQITASLAWPGTPWGVTASEIEGEVSAAIRQGSVPEVEPGFGRFLGLLNIAALHRRLTLDFSDFFGKGFSFDKIEGDLRFAEGLAHTDSLLIDGPAARIAIDGTANLAEHTLDHHVVVSGKLSSTLPIAGTLAGGPAVGAALLIAQHMLGDKVDQISAANYQLSGPWDNPEVLKIQPEVEQPDELNILGQ